MSLRIVYYHIISDERIEYFNGKPVTIKDFNDHLLKYRKKYNIISYKDINKSEKLKKNRLILTFDDNYKANYFNIKNILSDLNIKATFFINSDPILNKRLMWRDSLSLIFKNANHRLKKKFLDELNIKRTTSNNFFTLLKSYDPNRLMETIDYFWNDKFDCSQSQYIEENDLYFTIDDINNLINDGHEIGVHSHLHPSFQNINSTLAVDDITTCYKFIVDKFGYKPLTMSFPFGDKFNCNKVFNEITEKTSIRYFNGISYNILSNKKSTHHLERLGMEDHRNFLISFYLRPIIRLIK